MGSSQTRAENSDKLSDKGLYLRPGQGSSPLHPTLFCSLLLSSVSMLLIDVFYHFVEFKT